MSSWRPGLVISLPQVQELYDRHQFLDAYKRTAEYWKRTNDPARLSTDELVLGGRLAARLGGYRLSRWLFRIAWLRDPTNSSVRYFSRYWCDGNSVLDRLRAFEAQPELGGDDPEIRASWLSSHAYTWAMLRDFQRASDCIARAHTLSPDNSWVFSCESEVLGMADRWSEALQRAERAWELNPGAPYTATSLGVCLLNLGRVSESAPRLAAAAQGCQSHEVTQLACWHLCALSEVSEGDERHAVVARARDLADRLESLAPVADREARALFARVRLDVADVSDDHAAIERWANEVRSPFHRKVLSNLRQNPSGSRIRLPFRRVIQKYEACLPTSATSALSAMGVHISPDEMAAEITFGGTPDWAAAEWLKRRGLAVRFFCTTPPLAASLIRSGIAFVLTLEDDDSAHAVAAVGLDEAAGTLLIHDPQSFRITEYLLDSLGHKDAPFGPKAMAAVPLEKAALLDTLLPEDAQVTAADRAYERAIQLQGPSAAREVVTELGARFPAHPVTRLLHVIQALEDGRTGEALRGAQGLLQEFPGAAAVRSRLVGACRTLGNTALLRETLRSVVESGVLPGVQSQQEWVYPPSRYVCEYADLLRGSAATRNQARSLLRSVLRRQPSTAEAWHDLGDLLWQELDTEGALLCYRLASCLSGSNEHYARAYADALVHADRQEEGLAWLETRARTFGDSAHARLTWVSWISALEDGGHPERALAACRQALLPQGDSPDLLAFVVPFLARMGHWREAEEHLLRLQAGRKPAAFHEAGYHYHRMRGELPVAIKHVEAWVRESPRALPARIALLNLVAKHDGVDVAVRRAAGWMGQQPDHEGLEELYCEQLRLASGPNWRRYSVLLRRLKRNPEDAWAWREMAFATMEDYERASEARLRLEPRIVEFLAQCDRTAPQDPATLRAHARWYEVRGQWHEAVDAWLQAIDAEPANFFSYRHAWDCAANFDREQRNQVWERIEPKLRRVPGRLAIARDIVGLLAARFGATTAEEVAWRWKLERSDDPDVLEAAAFALLEHGHGRSDAERALAVLKPAVEHFPYHLGLRFSLANSFRALGGNAEAEEVLREIIRRHPDNSDALLQLARVRERNGEVVEAHRLLDVALACDPHHSGIWDQRCQCLIRAGRLAEASAMVHQGLNVMPKDVGWRERAIALLIECGEDDDAIAAARDGVLVYPCGSYLWLLLARTLHRLPRFAAQREVESCLRRSLELNAGLSEAADWLAILFVEQRRYAEADKVMHAAAARLPDPSPARGRLAWIKREQGVKEQALADMAAAVQLAPWYVWGWGVLMDWLTEDRAWDRSLSLLGSIPAELRTNTEFRLRRLKLLAKAGLPAAELDTEWGQLLRDFPEDISLHLERHDSLAAAGRHPEAAALLRVILLVDRDSPYLLARLVVVLLTEQKQEEAIDAALRIWFAPVEESTWPTHHAWDAFADAKLSELAYERVRSRLQEGSRPTPGALARVAALAVARSNLMVQSAQPLWRSWFPHPGVRELLRLLILVETFPSGRATLLSLLCDHGYQRLVVKYWKRHPNAVEGDVDAWAQVGRSLLGLNRYKAARDVLSTWRERSGVEMFAVANYVLALSRVYWHRDQQELALTCRDALAGLRHDHCAKYLAHVRAEACARLGDTQAFLQTWNTYSGYFNNELEANEYFEPQRRELLEDIPAMARALEQSDVHAYRKRLRRLRWRAWRPVTQQNAGSGVSWWWLAVVLWVLLRLLSRL